MKLIPSTCATLYALALIGAENVALAEELCPSTSMPAETVPAPEGWRAWRTDESHTYELVDVAFTDGAPEERAFLSPLSATHHGAARVDHYDFTSSTLRDIWIVCQYRNTTIALVRKTDLRGQRCEASYANKRKASDLAALACK